MPRKSLLLTLPLVIALGMTAHAVAQNTMQKSEEKPPVEGANSFTENQAKTRIEGAGFTQVTGLRKDDQGIWRGSAMQNGKQVTVSLDFRGNVVGQ